MASADDFKILIASIRTELKLAGLQIGCVVPAIRNWKRGRKGKAAIVGRMAVTTVKPSSGQRRTLPYLTTT